MKFLVSGCSDKGIVKKVNQDSFCYKVIQTNKNMIFFAVLCDGMGGLNKGEVASATVVKEFSNWAESNLKNILSMEYDNNIIKKEFSEFVQNINDRIYSYGKEIGTAIGTTLAAILIIDDKYYTVSVGDTRIYKIKNAAINQVTHDHSLVQREIDEGILSKEEARNDSRKNILLQCIGAKRKVSEDILFGQLHKDTVFLLSTDGFWNKLDENELAEEFNPIKLSSELEITNKIKTMISKVKSKKEKDNISVIVVNCY